jgi:hypothetical protein
MWDEIPRGLHCSIHRVDVHPLTPPVVKVCGQVQQTGDSGDCTGELGGPVLDVAEVTGEPVQPRFDFASKREESVLGVTGMTD